MAAIETIKLVLRQNAAKLISAITLLTVLSKSKLGYTSYVRRMCLECVCYVPSALEILNIEH